MLASYGIIVHNPTAAVCELRAITVFSHYVMFCAAKAVMNTGLMSTSLILMCWTTKMYFCWNNTANYL